MVRERGADMIKRVCKSLALSAVLLPLLAQGAETAESFEQAYATASAARKQAASVGFEWRDTRKLLKRAKKAAEGGDFDTAVTLADRARFESEQAVEQAQLQADHWQDAVPK